ncbi:sigma-54-dependent transcriptional regulator [Solidesulfovibrio alcoholivorans]|uniref:sigma-54-dependent transcriptional regulator n=1 Tax=Solidesulfovibrio alcoholivorans TaxID=81406 RepID=UPI00049826CA|nr:sigma-54 dependent transcriptional regulator [Solidesulfovibrio alcoholivorans]
MYKTGAINLLVVDDEQSIRRLAQKALAAPDRVVTTAESAEKAIRLTLEQDFDVVLLDIRLPDSNGLGLLERFRERLPDVEVIMITAYAEVASAVEAMKIGAYDYITKPFSLERIKLVIEKAYQRSVLQRENRILRRTGTPRPDCKLVGHSLAIKQILFLISKVAPTRTPVLITGESGVGKDVVAHNIHNQSACADRPLVIKNCGTFNKELLRSELFGYRKGAFTGATESRDGLLALANNGTLFLDEVGELSLELQSMLLRLLESQTYRRVGETEERKVNIRFLFATNRDLAKEVEAGRFHEALFHRLNIFRIEVPPLRERIEDIPALTTHFLGHIYPDRPPYKIAPTAEACFLSYHWPGNVREMRNVLERAIILSENDLVTAGTLPQEIVGALDGAEKRGILPTLEQSERQLIMRVLNHVGGNRTVAAKMLGIGRKTLYRKMCKFKLPQ